MQHLKFLCVDGSDFSIVDPFSENYYITFKATEYDQLEDTTKYEIEIGEDIKTLGDFMSFLKSNFGRERCYFGRIYIWCGNFGEVSPLVGWKYDNANPNLQHNIPEKYLNAINIGKDNLYCNEKTKHNGIYAYGSGNMLNLYFNLVKGHEKLRKESPMYSGQI